MLEAATIALIVIALGIGLFLRDNRDMETQADIEIAELFCISVQEASDHTKRFGESERMWARSSSYEDELKRRGFDPVKIWLEKTSARFEGRPIELSKCQYQADIR